MKNKDEVISAERTLTPAEKEYETVTNAIEVELERLSAAKAKLAALQVEPAKLGLDSLDTITRERDAIAACQEDIDRGDATLARLRHRLLKFSERPPAAAGVLPPCASE